MTKTIKTHAKNLELTQAKLDKLLFDHKPTFFEKLSWPLVFISLLILIFATSQFWSDPDSPPSSDQTPAISSDPDTLLTRSTARGVASGIALQTSSLLAQNPFANGFKSVFTGLAFGQHHPATWLPFISFQSISIGSHLGISTQLAQTKSGISGIQAGQNLAGAGDSTDPISRSSQLTQILGEIKKPLTATTFFKGPITDPPTEINHAKSIFQAAQTKALNAITEVRQIELDLKTKHDSQKRLVEALSDSLSLTLEKTISSQVPSKTKQLQTASALLATLKTEFQVFQTLEADFRAAEASLQTRLDFISKHFQNLALGLCDWQTC